MFRYGIFTEDLGSGKDILHLLLLRQLLVGLQLLLEGQEHVVSFGYDVVGEVVETGVVHTGLRAKVGLALKELHSLLCAIHALSDNKLIW